MPYPDDGELYLWGDSQKEGAVRMRFPAANRVVIERRVSGAFVASDLEPADGLGTPKGAGVTVSTQSAVAVRETVLTLADAAVDITDADANGAHGFYKVYDFPEGLIHILGASMDLTTAAGEGGIADNAAVVGSLGSDYVGTDNATLTGAEADIIPSTAGTLTSGAGALAGKATTTQAATVFDGTSTAVIAVLNVAVPADDASDDDTLTVNGTIRFTWCNLGDV